jgi:4-hydroxybenzoate polyprenyltransferase
LRRNFRIVDGSRWPYLLSMQPLAELEMKYDGDARRRRPTWSWRGSARKGAISALGFGTLAIGLALTVTPVPSALVILLGLAVLAREYAWARRLMGPCRELARRLVTPVRRLLVGRALLGSGGR